VAEELSGFKRLEKSTPDEVRCIDGGEGWKNLENRREGRGREKWLNSESVTQTKGKGVGVSSNF
jgi:hypothetical protein